MVRAALPASFLILFVTALLLLFVPADAEEETFFSSKDLALADASDAMVLELGAEGAVISQPGTYVLSGRVENGTIRVEPEEEGTVYLLLNGVIVHNESGPALISDGCDKLILTLAEGTENALTQGSQVSSEETVAAVYSRDDLTLNGTGALLVSSGSGDGINCRDSLRIVGGEITVDALDDGLVGKDEVSIGGGTLVITAQEGDGIKSTNDEDASRGFVAVTGGDITITTGEGHSGAAPSADGWGSRSSWEAQEADSSSQKGLKAETDLILTGGSLTVDTPDDALHANGNITLSGGTLVLATDDDAMHADGTLTISAGDLFITASYEGLEATDIAISGGTLRITASDDGINGAGGDQAEAGSGGWGGEMGRFGRDMFSSSTGTLEISGGVITVYAGGDGVDINGSITMSGAQVYVLGSPSSGNSALDYDGTFTLTGGTLVAAGASGMAQGVSDPSIPGTAVSVSDSGAIRVEDAQGETIVQFDAEGSFNHVVVYSDRFAENESYTLISGSSSQSVTMSVQASGLSGRTGRGGRRGP